LPKKQGHYPKEFEWDAQVSSQRIVAIKILLVILFKLVDYREVLEEPCSEDVCGHFWEDSSFLLIFLSSGVVVIFSSSVAASYARIARIAWTNRKKGFEKKRLGDNGGGGGTWNQSLISFRGNFEVRWGGIRRFMKSPFPPRPKKPPLTTPLKRHFRGNKIVRKKGRTKGKNVSNFGSFLFTVSDPFIFSCLKI